MNPTLQILEGDCLRSLATLPDNSVHCCVTSPPYWGLRDYGVDGQLGLEKTPEEYVTKMVEVFAEVWRVLRPDGTLWLNLGDSYNAAGRNGHGTREGFKQGTNRASASGADQSRPTADELKPKDLCGIPWRVAFALQAEGWWLRQDIIWHKPSPMPESVTDRCTKAHEYLFLLSKSERYFYDAEAIKEASITNDNRKPFAPGQVDYRGNGHDRGGGCPTNRNVNSRNKRDVWTIPSAPYSEAHFATFPPDLVKPCILAGTSARGCCPKCGTPWERVVKKSGGTIGSAWNDSGDFPKEVRQTKHMRVGGQDLGNGEYQVETLGWRPGCECGETSTVPCIVLDPFLGSGTTAMVALELGRSAIGCELNSEYIQLARQRCQVTPGLAL